jgi:hypothetical protein
MIRNIVPGRTPFVPWMQEHARAALASALETGDEVTSLGAVPSLRIAQLVDTRRHAVEQILREGIEHQQAVLDACADVLERLEARSVGLDANARRRWTGEEQQLTSTGSAAGPASWKGCGDPPRRIDEACTGARAAPMRALQPDARGERAPSTPWKRRVGGIAAVTALG